MGHVGLESLRSIPISDVAEPYLVRHLALFKSFSIDLGYLEQFLYPLAVLKGSLFSTFSATFYFLKDSSFHFYFSFQFTECLFTDNSEHVLNRIAFFVSSFIH